MDDLERAKRQLNVQTIKAKEDFTADQLAVAGLAKFKPVADSSPAMTYDEAVERGLARPLSGGDDAPKLPAMPAVTGAQPSADIMQMMNQLMQQNFQLQQQILAMQQERQSAPDIHSSAPRPNRVLRSDQMTEAQREKVEYGGGGLLG